jgi:N-methylhydantoinase A
MEEKVARPLGLDTFEAAYGAYSIANVSMMRVIRSVSSERGRDPRKFALYAFGGAGPAHAVGVARELGIRKITIPPVPGVCSALGLLCAALEELNSVFDAMAGEATSSVQLWGGRKKVKPHIKKLVDIRYEGQAWELSIEVPEGRLEQPQIAALADDFRAEYQKIYGYSLNTPLHVVNLRLVATLPSERPSLVAFNRSANHDDTRQKAPVTRRAYWGKEYGFMDTPVLELRQIGERPSQGPILVDCYDTTIVVPPGCTISTGEWGNVSIEINSESR